MTDFVHIVPIKASAKKVFAAIATQLGNQGWWTHDTVLDPRVGGTAEFGFDRRGAVFHMRIDELVPERRLVMSCSGEHPEWNGTTLEWTLIPDGDEGISLHFTHRNWMVPTDFAASCNSMWGNLMYRLKDFVESGKPAPQWTT
jgi:uncharacterized protein YndB with AHSA1/START domain